MTDRMRWHRAFFLAFVGPVLWGCTQPNPAFGTSEDSQSSATGSGGGGEATSNATVVDPTENGATGDTA